MSNETFAENSWYFRNALVRANYNDLQKGIYATTKFLEMFFENLLMNAGHKLRIIQYSRLQEEDIFMQFGMPTLIENGTLEDNICLCKKLNLQFLELNMNFPEYQLHKLEQTDKFYRAADESGLYYTIHLDENLNVADFNMLIADAYLETVKRTIEVAKKLISLRDKYGEKSQPLVVNMHMHHGTYVTLPDRKVQMYDRDFDVYFDSFVKFRTLCEEWIGDSDIIVSIENTDGFREYEKRAIDYLLESPKFGLTWDIGHSKGTGETDVPFIMQHFNKLRHFHIHDGIAKSDKHKGRAHLALGDGEINIQERLSMADDKNARCVLETKTIAALRKSVEYLEAFTQALNLDSPIRSKASFRNESLRKKRTAVETAANSVEHDMSLFPEPFEKIKSGRKTIELRLWDEKRQKIKIGDTIVFTNTVSGDKLRVTALNLHRFDSFEELYKNLSLLKCGYKEDEIDTAQPSDMDEYYSAEKQAKYGVVGIEICLTNNRQSGSFVETESE